MTRLSITHPAVLFALAALCALALAIWPSSTAGPGIDLYFHNTYFVAPLRHLAIGVGLLSALCASVYWLFPKLFGRNLNTSLGQLHFWLSVLGLLATVISFFSMHRLIDSAGIADSGSLKAVALGLTTFIAPLIFLLAQAIFAFNVLRSLLKGSQP